MKDYTTNYESLATLCAKLAFREPAPVRSLREYVVNVQRTMSLDNMRRYSRHTILLTADSTISAENKQKLMNMSQPVIDKALSDYTATAAKYLEKINTLATKLDVTPIMQYCQQRTQNSTISQMSDANTLISLPSSMCDQMNSVFAYFEKSMDSAYSKIGAQIPYFK